MGEVHQDTWEAQSPAHRAMSQILTQQEAAGVGGASEELQGPFDLPASRGEEVCVVQASLGKNQNAKRKMPSHHHSALPPLLGGHMPPCLPTPPSLGTLYHLLDSTSRFLTPHPYLEPLAS